jgi:hypothetical protein
MMRTLSCFPLWQCRLLAAMLLLGIVSADAVDRQERCIDLLQECEDLEIEDDQEEAGEDDRLAFVTLPSLSITLLLAPGPNRLTTPTRGASPFICQHLARPPPSSRI